MEPSTLASGGLAFIVGYALAKAAKLVLILLGVFILTLLLLENSGFITINWDKLTSSVLQLAQQLTDTLDPETLGKMGVPIAGLAAGLYLGLRK